MACTAVQAIAQASYAQATINAQRPATELFQRSMQSTLVCAINAAEAQQREFQEAVHCPVNFTSGVTYTACHPLMAMARDGVRRAHWCASKVHKPKECAGKMRCIGAAFREVCEYWVSPNIEFHIRAPEPADVARILEPCLASINVAQVARAEQADKCRRLRKRGGNAAQAKAAESERDRQLQVLEDQLEVPKSTDPSEVLKAVSGAGNYLTAVSAEKLAHAGHRFTCLPNALCCPAL